VPPEPSTAAEREPARHPSTVPAIAQPYQGRRAGLVSRVLAAGIDGLVVVVILTAAYLGLVGAIFLLSPKSFAFPSPSVVFAVTGFLVVLTLYFTASWATTGRTYGDHVMALRVVNFRGRRLRWAGAFVRALACALFPIGLLWVALSRENRSVQDLMLRTSVIYDWRESVPAADTEPAG
jgi:uncharacterized RDD family membrane protein YckC